MRWALLGAAIASEVTATLALKGALEHGALYALVAAGYLASFALLAEVLGRGMPLGVTYGIWAATGVAATALMSALIFGEQVTTLMAAGLALVMAGVLMVELGHQRATRGER